MLYKHRKQDKKKLKRNNNKRNLPQKVIVRLFIYIPAQKSASLRGYLKKAFAAQTIILYPCGANMA